MKCPLHLELYRFFFSVLMFIFPALVLPQPFLYVHLVLLGVDYGMPESKLTVQYLAKSQHFEHFEPRMSQFQALKESSEHLVLGFLKKPRSDLYWF